MLKEVGEHTDAEGNQKITDEHRQWNSKFAVSVDQGAVRCLGLVHNFHRATGEMRTGVSQLIGAFFADETCDDFRFRKLLNLVGLRIDPVVLDDRSLVSDARHDVGCVIQSTQTTQNENKCDDSHHHEDKGLKGVCPRRPTRPTSKNVGKNHDAHHQAAEPGRDAAIHDRIGILEKAEHSRGHWLDRLASTDDTDEQVRNYQCHQYGKQNEAKRTGLKAFTEELNLRDEAVFPSKGPQPDSNQEEAGSMNQAAA